MGKHTEEISRNNVLLNTALKSGRKAGFSDEVIYEKLVHFLLDLHDEAFQEKLNSIMKQDLCSYIMEPPTSEKKKQS